MHVFIVWLVGWLFGCLFCPLLRTRSDLLSLSLTHTTQPSAACGVQTWLQEDRSSAQASSPASDRLVPAIL